MSGTGIRGTGTRTSGGTGTDRALLEAGAVLPDSPATAFDDTDHLTARSYRHPALDGRTVVRLVPGALGPAEDLALEYLGFAGDGAPPAGVGRVLRRSLGFPAWALVNDPANGHHALAVVKEMERLTRLITTKPGNAKEGFDEIGVRLDRSVPAFLPTYYEQVARLFLGGESRTYATTFFGKAREAERLHGLAIDEDRLREVFVEFAAAGALSVKALRDHTKALGARLTPGEAFAQFHALCLGRVAAGLAPYAGLLEDLRRLAKAAGQDVAACERDIVGRVLASGSVERAPQSFWKAAGPAVVALARQDPELRRRLLALKPSAGGDTRAAFDTAWLAMLDDGGALALLEDGDVPAAPWLSGWARHRLRGWGAHPRIAADLALVDRLVPRLRADAVPVELTLDRYRDVCDLDLLEACLAAGVPVADPPAGLQLPLSAWLDDDSPGRREPAALLSDARFEPFARAAVETLASGSDGPARLLDLAGSALFRPVIAGWLADRAGELDGEVSLPWIGERLERLARFDAPAVLALAPATVRRITATDPAPALARALRSGLFAELGWEALEETAHRLAPPGANGARPALRVHDAWPALIVSSGSHAALVGADAVLDERPVVLPSPLAGRWDHSDIRHVDGQWLVVSGGGDKRRGVWSGRPTEVFAPDGFLGDHSLHQGHVSLALPGGGRTVGSRPLHPGDTVLGLQRPVACDGVSYWTLEQGDWREFDPAGGRLGRESVPGFFDRALAEGTGGTLRGHACRLLPCPPGLESSPFGTKDGLLGWWVRDDDGVLTACSVDGGRHALPSSTPGAHRYAYRARVLLPPMRLPGGVALYPYREGSTVRFHDAHGRLTGHTEPDGWEHGALVPPVAHWHLLRPRDEAGSAALRNVTDAAAAAMLAAVAVGRTPAEAVAAALPAVTHPRLAAAVAHEVRTAAGFARRFARLAERARRPAGDQVVARHARDGLLASALDGLWGGSGRYGRPDRSDRSSRTLALVRDLARFLETPADRLAGATFVTAVGTGWRNLLGEGLAAAVWRAASPVLDDEQRLAVAEVAGHVLDGAGGALADPRGRLRVVELLEPLQDAPERLGHVLLDGGRRLLFLLRSSAPERSRGWVALEHDPSGAFGAWPGLTERDSEVLGAPGDPSRAGALRRAVRLLTERGALPFAPERAAALGEAASIDPCVAATLLLGLPAVDGWGRSGLPERAVLDGYGLGTADAELARKLLTPLSTATRVRLLAALVPATPEAVETLWDGEFPVAGAAAVWEERVGRQPLVPSALLIRAQREHAWPVKLMRALTPHAQPELTGRTRQIPEQQLEPEDGAALLTGQELTEYAHALRWLAYRLPGGDPLRALLPGTLRTLRERIADPGLLLSLGASWTPEGTALAPAVRAAHGLPEKGGAGPDGLVTAGPALVLAPDRWGHHEAVWLRPAALAGPDGGPGHPALTLLTGLLPGNGVLRALRDVLGTGLEAAVTAAGPDGFPHDPTRSVPDLVTEAAARLACGEDAAALYLALLALPDPTDRHVAEWTGWKPARLRAARAALAATGQVVEAKRSRAGRSLFLPGGWQEHGTPRLPLEVWKAPLFDAAQDGVTLPSGPVAELFRTAWARVTGGDAPAYEEFVGRRAGRGARGGAR